VPPKNRVEQDESEHTTDVKQDECQYDCGEDSHRDQSDELPDVFGNVRGINGRPSERQTRRREASPAVAGLIDREIEAVKVASASVQFGRQNSNQRQARPLSETEVGE
jgi:hypothetical protein